MIGFKQRAAGIFFAMLASLAALPAFADDDVGSVVSTAISGANPQIVTVIGAMAGALVLIVVWSLVRRAMGK